MIVRRSIRKMTCARREDLEARVAGIFLKRAEKVVFVRGDDDVDFEYVADAVMLLRSWLHHAGVQRRPVGLLTAKGSGRSQFNVAPNQLVRAMVAFKPPSSRIRNRLARSR